ncbi:Acid stress protein IbaG [invertebrate metagenome]|uniref:Acid stress protein IbaG n=1 Tax=invertebrate metagenome TaxID=1711999 RepID=A0A2H9TCR4_9ZZZZ
MEATDIKQLLEQKIEDSEVLVDGSGCDLQVTVVSDQFKGIRPVRRQQMVYQHLNEWIANGSIHAVSMVTLTPDEKREKEDQ